MILSKNFLSGQLFFFIAFLTSPCIFDKVFAQSSAILAFGAQHTSSVFFPKLNIRQKPQPIISLQGYLQGTTPKFYNRIQQEVEIEALDSFVVVRQTVMQLDVRPPLVISFSEYRNLLQAQTETIGWHEYIVRDLTAQSEGARGPGGINLDIPVRIKSKAFQKIFGSGTVGLTVTGNININMAVRREDRSQVQTAITQGASTNFKMEQKQRFSVTGKIGDKVTVNVDQDSERAFDFDNNVRLVYQGYEDEILQRLEAGNIALSLPGTKYVTFSGKNAGLFGIKSELVLGNLNVTAIASQEKGESQRLSLTGGAQAGSRIVRDHEYLRFTYFFLDTLYRSEFRRFSGATDRVHIVSSDPIDGESIEVYKARGNNFRDTDKSIEGWATISGDTSEAEPTKVEDGIAERGHFIRLEKSEYYVEPNLGWIRLNTPVAADEILAVAYRRLNSGTVAGHLAPPDTLIRLKLIKSRNPIPSVPTANLEWKHVYSLGGRNIDSDGFDIKIFFEPSAGVPQETNDNGQRWLQVFGLDEKDKNGAPNPDGEVDLELTFVDLVNGELHFPDLRPFDPVGYFEAGQSVDIRLPNELREKAIYDTTEQSIINAQSRFYIDIKSQNRSNSYDLGFNVIEGSEVVTLEGSTLRNGVDYTIDYFSGRLTIINEQALSPAANLDITYERNQLFQLEKKTIFGMRAEYELSRDSFIGGTLLYLNQTTLDRKVRVGQGPMQNLVWDINSRLRLTPNFIGNALDFLPLIRAKGETNLNLEGEIAQVIPTPNTLNSPRTGDDQGVAYIDDFEAAKKTFNLGILRRNWTMASQPNSEHTFGNVLDNFVWYNPFGQIAINDIYPEREVNPNVPNKVHVLRLDFFPDPNLLTLEPNTWGGVMRALSSGAFDQSQTKFVEIMVQGNNGRLHVDLGRISEDAIPNGRLNTEDDAAGITRNGILDITGGVNEDIGLDGVNKPDPPSLHFPRSMFAGDSLQNVPHDFWDVNNNRIKDADEPWSYDDWFYQESSIDYIQLDGSGSIVGTQNNANDQGGREPDTEDINGNGFLDQSNAFYKFSFRLEDDHPDSRFVVGGNPNNPDDRGGPWKLYRIPFATTDTTTQVGNPSPTQIEFVRIWIDSLDVNKEDLDLGTPIIRTSIAEVNLVGSEWKELGRTFDEFNNPPIAGDSTIAVAQINTHENVAYSATLSEIGVEGEIDQVTGVRAREQSLVLVANSLPPQEAGLAQKSLFRGENYIHYKRIKMFVHGDESTFASSHIPSDTSGTKSYLEYFIRFGADENNYYEYRSTVYSGWNDKNHMDVPILEFSNFDRSDTTLSFNSITGTFFKYLTEDSSKSIRIKGSPSLTNVKVLTLGLKNKHPNNIPFTGEIWFNELRLSDVLQDKGMAMRARADLRIADFVTIRTEAEKLDADFHRITERFSINQQNTISSSMNANVNMDKLLPQSWGLAMPLSLTYRSSNSTPKYVPGQDKLVTPQDSPDVIRTINNQTGFNFSFSKVSRSKNIFVKNTIDNLKFNIGRSESKAENPSLKFSNSTAWSGSADYSLNFGRDNYVKIFSWLPGLPLLKKAKDTKLYFTPQNVSFRVNGAKSNQMSQNRIQNSNQFADTTATETFTLDRSVRANMKVFESLTVDYNRTHKGDLRGKTFSDIVNNRFQDINVAQTFSARYNPRIFNWLNNNFSYSSNYTFNYNLQQQNTGRSARSNNTRSADFTFKWKDFARSVFGVGKRATTPGRGTRRGQNQPLNFFQEEEEGGGFPLNPFKLVGGLLSKFKDIGFNYTERTNNTQLGLVSGSPSLAFQFGLSDTTDLGTVASLTTNTITSSINRSYTANSGLALGRAIDVGLRFQHSELENQSTIISGNSSDSWLQFGDFDLPFPEWTVRIGGLASLPIFSKLFRTVTFSHNFSGKRDINWTENSNDGKTQRSTTTNFRPLGKLDLNLHNGITGNIQINRSKTLSETLTTGGENLTKNMDVSLTASYSKRSGFRIPIWPFNKAELKNSIDFSLTFAASSSSTKNKAPSKNEFEELDSTKRWSFSPRMTYSFSNQVRGGAFLEIGETDSKRVGKTSIQEFGLDINIVISGR